MALIHYAPRAVQIDSRQLDAQFLELITTQIGKLKIYSFDRFASELKLIFQIYLWYKKTYLSNSSIGLDLFKLKFCNTSNGNDLKIWQKCSFLGKIALVYLSERFNEHLDLKQSLILEKLGALFNLFQIVNTFVFLYGGRYRTIEERFFGIRIEPLNKSTNLSQTASTFLNRELLWQSLSEVLALLLPSLLSTNRLKHFVKMMISSIAVLNKDQFTQHRPETSSTCCSLCHQAANNATSFDSCLHLYCYYCISAHLMSHSTYKCNSCNISIQSFDQLTDRFVP